MPSAAFSVTDGLPGRRGGTAPPVVADDHARGDQGIGDRPQLSDRPPKLAGQVGLLERFAGAAEHYDALGPETGDLGTAGPVAANRVRRPVDISVDRGRPSGTTSGAGFRRAAVAGSPARSPVHLPRCIPGRQVPGPTRSHRRLDADRHPGHDPPHPLLALVVFFTVGIRLRAEEVGAAAVDRDTGFGCLYGRED